MNVLEAGTVTVKVVAPTTVEVAVEPASIWYVRLLTVTFVLALKVKAAAFASAPKPTRAKTANKSKLIFNFLIILFLRFVNAESTLYKTIKETPHIC